MVLSGRVSFNQMDATLVTILGRPTFATEGGIISTRTVTGLTSGAFAAGSDVNGDGLSDIYWMPNRDTPILISGAMPFNLQVASLPVLLPALIGKSYGSSMTMGDYNGDGYGDVAMSAKDAPSSNWEGAVVVLLAKGGGNIGLSAPDLKEFGKVLAP